MQNRLNWKAASTWLPSSASLSKHQRMRKSGPGGKNLHMPQCWFFFFFYYSPVISSFEKMPHSRPAIRGGHIWSQRCSCMPACTRLRRAQAQNSRAFEEGIWLVPQLFFPSPLSANLVTHAHMAQIVDEYEGMLRLYNRKDERHTFFFFLHAK